ncbi:MAG TPA: tRNA preQ1(34) S-adenosylmethionine ribosyltransferase-isomerase QueA [Pyrinomonadaceae bacterium]|nr:tRNA preQ1(34) S-adenosylmethionine ribosyltransferase-isomerase QueA [Pyrinomonadaceae bacterium]
MFISEFDFDLPGELIAQHPLAQRESSRMLCVDRSSGAIADDLFDLLPDRLRPGDLLVLNNTKVFPARLSGQTDTGAHIEIFLIREIGAESWEALAKPLRRLRPGKRIKFGERLTGRTVAITAEGRAEIQFEFEGDLRERIDEVGRTPIPPYIKREEGAIDEDRDRYQTVFAANRGAIAAPTAGLHFTPEVFDRLRRKGIEIAELTLHVGYGTFEPVRVEDLSMHKVMPERYEISDSAAASLNRARAERRRVIAVGTTTTRTLENALQRHHEFKPESGNADLTITPGFEFRAIDGMLTNFHLPKSSLLVLVSTFGGHELIMKAYDHAVRERYRFYSYGDCMLIV